MNKLIKVNGRDIDIFFEEQNDIDRFVKEIILNEEYSHAFKHKTIIDVGANIGTFSLYAYDFADVIYTIEPLLSNYNNLVKTIETNKLDKIKPFHLALSDKNGEGFMVATDNYAGSHLGDTGEVVQMMTLASFMRQNEVGYVDVLKVDTEGHEGTIFMSGDFKGIAGNINTIIYEHSFGDESRYFESMGFKHGKGGGLNLCKKI